MDYDKYTVKQPKFKLKIYEKKISGKKADLIERLESAEKPILTTLDTDRLIYMYLDDVSLFNICMMNSYVNDVICDDMFWRYRIEKIFGINTTEISMKGSHKEIYKYLRYPGKYNLLSRICDRGYTNMLKSILNKFQLNVRLKCTDRYEAEIMRNILLGKYNDELVICIFISIMRGYIDILRILVKRKIRREDLSNSAGNTAIIRLKFEGDNYDRYQEIRKYCEEKIPFIVVEQ